MKFFAVFTAIVAVACASHSEWTINSLSEAIMDPNTDPAMIPYLTAALNELMFAAMTGNPLPAISVSTSAEDISYWTLQELSEALQDPTTDPALVPYLEEAINTIMQNLMDGQQQDTIIVATPVGLLPDSAVVAPIPVVEAPVVETPVAETPVASSSPLVQIIVNVNKQEATVSPVEAVAVAAPEVNPVDIINPLPVAPVNIVDQAVGPIV